MTPLDEWTPADVRSLVRPVVAGLLVLTVVWFGACRSWDARKTAGGALTVSVQPRYFSDEYQCGVGRDGSLRIVPK